MGLARKCRRHFLVSCNSANPIFPGAQRQFFFLFITQSQKCVKVCFDPFVLVFHLLQFEHITLWECFSLSPFYDFQKVESIIFSEKFSVPNQIPQNQKQEQEREIEQKERNFVINVIDSFTVAKNAIPSNSFTLLSWDGPLTFSQHYSSKMNFCNFPSSPPPKKEKSLSFPNSVGFLTEVFLTDYLTQVLKLPESPYPLRPVGLFAQA